MNPTTTPYDAKFNMLLVTMLFCAVVPAFARAATSAPSPAKKSHGANSQTAQTQAAKPTITKAPTAKPATAKPSPAVKPARRTLVLDLSDLELEISGASSGADKTPTPKAKPAGDKHAPSPATPKAKSTPEPKPTPKPTPTPKPKLTPSPERTPKPTATPKPTPKPKPVAPPPAKPVYAPPLPAAELPTDDRPKQYIVLSFDGSRSVQMWKEARALALELNIGLTVFMSGVHFLPESVLKKAYDPPGPEYGPGASAIRKIADSERASIPERMEQVEDSVGEGIEVGSHAVGHFDAKALDWSTTDWISELTQFQNILLNVFSLNSLPERYPGEAKTWKQLIGESLRGFRAPFLATNGTLAPALQKLGYRYDGSEAYPMEWGKWPFKKKDADIWEIPMAQVPILGTAKTQVAMDYNFYAFDSNATPDLKNSAFYSQRWYDSLINYFRHNYYGNRAPIHIGAHFDDYNGRAYFNGFFRFARAVCRKPEVVCVTGSELLRKMQSLGPDRIAAYQHGNFVKYPMPADLPRPKTLDLKIGWSTPNGNLRLHPTGAAASDVVANRLRVHVYSDGQLVATQLGEIRLPTTSGTRQIRVRVFKDGAEILSSTRRADVRAGVIQTLESDDRERLLQNGDLPGAHGMPDTSGLLPNPQTI